MEPYQQRVADEKTALDEKIEKLSAFIHSDDKMKGVSEPQAMLMGAQLSAMQQYSDILGQRLQLFQAR